MGSANLTDEEVAMRYPPSILEWEMKHGLARYERNGMLYICATRPLEEINASIRREKEEKEARRRMQKEVQGNEFKDHS